MICSCIRSTRIEEIFSLIFAAQFFVFSLEGTPFFLGDKPLEWGIWRPNLEKAWKLITVSFSCPESERNTKQWPNPFYLH